MRDEQFIDTAGRSFLRGGKVAKAELLVIGAVACRFVSIFISLLPRHFFIRFLKM